jgi:hypothetical protein
MRHEGVGFHVKVFLLSHLDSKAKLRVRFATP